MRFAESSARRSKLLASVLVLAAMPCLADSYAGSQACAGCHRQIYEQWARSAMARSLERPGTEGPREPVTVYNAASQRYYQVFRDANGLSQSEYQLGGDGKAIFRVTHPVAYVVGSGNNGHSYIVRHSGGLFQAPLSFYSRSGSWELSPGYERSDPGFGREILPVCIDCHGGREKRIGCEDCHGPGQAHVAAAGKGGIVNPVKLPSRLAEDICMRCHQDGDARILQPGKSEADFRPGRPLSETVALFRIPETAETSDLLEHHLAMRASKCYTGSGGKLGCLTCHNPHAPTGEARNHCGQCHAEAACTLPREKRGPADCVSCHMPKREARQVSHSALTQHRIVRRPGQPAPAAAENLPGLLYLNGSPGDLPRVTLLQAYAQLLEKRPDSTSRYLALLEETRRSDPRHPFVLAALGRKALRESDPRAVEILTDAVRAPAISPVPYQDLAEALTRAGRDADAARVLREGTGRFPFSGVLQKLLAARYIALHEYPAARQTITGYLDLFPEDSFMREMLRRFDAAPKSGPRP